LSASIDSLALKLSGRESDFDALKEVIEDNENDKFGFIYNTEEFLRNIDLSVEAPPSIESVGKSTLGSG
jgi:hypothetical protein